MNIFIAKLSSRTNDESLKTLFEQFGEVKSARVIMDKETGFSKKYGFVEMDNEQEGNDAIAQTNETEFEGSTIIVKKARPREDNRGGGGGGYRSEGSGGGYRSEGGGGGYRGGNGRSNHRDGGRQSNRY
ncbi:MAG: RNA-binding protein [Bacteroidia bacterium]|nr:RNA-binding protein [Bacteroidales bacterium]NCD42401.1 RNA-binding protein [Bacteroidia bacterium]MDD2323826.1 RNA-binding protein [Bacteroidales bacterium]MDD3010257.1 RNA-binding protein [Bacteroidales bacterium]MDD3961989.1 RNA-binding protein [Bacteroidales bacterium]